jgi:thiaminase
MRDTIDMAREAGAGFYIDNTARVLAHWKFTAGQLKAFEALVRADEREARSIRWDELIAKTVEAEREACAQMAEQKGLTWKARENINPDNAARAYMASQFIATAIRARGQA